MNLWQKIKAKYDCRKSRFLSYVTGRVDAYEEGEYIVSFRVKKTGETSYVLRYNDAKIKNLDTNDEKELNYSEFSGWIDLARRLVEKTWKTQVEKNLKGDKQ